PGEDLLRRGPGQPIDRVLQDARERVVVLGRRDQHTVGRRDLTAEGADGLRSTRSGPLKILVERRDRGELIIEHDRHPWRGQFSRGTSTRTVVGIAAKAPGEW